MRKFIVLAALAAAFPAIVNAEMTTDRAAANEARHLLEVGTELGTTPEAITESLRGLGFTVGGVKAEDTHFVARVNNGSARGAVFVDGTTGKISSATID